MSTKQNEPVRSTDAETSYHFPQHTPIDDTNRTVPRHSNQTSHIRSFAMDLLEGYGSSTDDDDEHDDPGRVNRASAGRGAGDAATESSHQSLVGPVLGTQTGTPAAAAAAAASIGVPAASPSFIKPNTEGSARGKKVLSLTSFLPPHVLARLTKAQALRPARQSLSQRSAGAATASNQDESDDDTDDDEEDEDEDDGADHQSLDDGRGSTGSTVKSGGRRSAGATTATDDSLSLLLRDLHDSKPAATVGAAAPKQQEQQQQQQQPLGQAFVSLQSDSAKPRRSDHGVVVDVHRPTTTATTTTRSTIEQADTQASTSGSRSLQLPQPGRSLARQVKAAPMPTPSLRQDNKGSPIPLTSSVHHSTAQHAAYANQGTSTFGVAPTEAVNVPQYNKKKRSRQELERALRQGNVQVLKDPSHAFLVDVQSLQQADPTEYAPEAESAHEASLRQSQQHGIRVAPTLMYDASTGTAESVVVGPEGGPKLKGRGKNQIHHVVAAAAQLEMQRARQNPSSSGSGSTHRVNAKAKYGW